MNRYLTPRQVADWIQVKPTTIYQWVHRGLIPFVKFGEGKSTVRFKEEAIQKWLEEKEQNKRRRNFEE